MSDILAGLVLVAGMSRRMGDFKPLLPLRGRTLIENTVASLLENSVDKVVVVTGYRSIDVERVLTQSFDNRVMLVRNPHYVTTEMIDSIKIGCEQLPVCDAFYLLPGDMPVVKQSTFQQLQTAWSEHRGIIFPTLDGYRKHPPLITRSFTKEIINFTGAGGLRELWKLHEDLIYDVAVDDEGVWVDLDHTQDYIRCTLTYDAPISTEERMIDVPCQH